MSTTKLSVTIELPGSTMMSSQVCEENPLSYDKNKIILNVKKFDKKTKKPFIKTIYLEVKTRKCIPAHQTINMSRDAYDYMISPNCPDWYVFMGGVAKWKKLSIHEKLEQHLNRICASLGGTSYTYSIFKE